MVSKMTASSKPLKFMMIVFLLTVLVFLTLPVMIVRASTYQHEGSVYDDVRDHAFNLTDWFSFNETTSNHGNKTFQIENFSVPVPSAGWNVTDMTINITNLTPWRMVIPIDTDPSGRLFKIDNETKVVASLVNLTTPFHVYGVYMLGRVHTQLSQVELDAKTIGDLNVTVSIQGYNDSNGKPNGTVIASTDLNMRDNTWWYVQSFGDGVQLNAECYYIVVNGTNFTSDNHEIWWHANEFHGNETNVWVQDRVNTWVVHDNYSMVMLAEIRGFTTIYPSEINLTANINGNQFNVTDGAVRGNGSVVIENVSITSTNTTLDIVFMNDLDMFFGIFPFEVSCDVTYQYNLTNEFMENGTITINSTITWSLQRNVTRWYDNYTLTMIKHHTWNAGTITLNGTDIKGECDINNNSITIHNDTFNANDLVMTLTSSNSSFNVSINNNGKYEPLQYIDCDITTPTGTFRFLIIDGSNEIVYGYDGDNVSSIFYGIPSSVNEGTWRLLALWHNDTDGGMVAISISVITPIVTTPPTNIAFIILVISSICAIIGGGSYGTCMFVMKERKKRIENREGIYKTVRESLNIVMVIIIQGDSGMTCFYRDYGNTGLDSSMVSGFLSATKMFGQEIGFDLDKEGMYYEKKKGMADPMEVNYKWGFKVLVSDLEGVRVAVLISDLVSDETRKSTDWLLHELVSNCKNEILRFRGHQIDMPIVSHSIMKTFKLQWIYPFVIREHEGMSLSSSENALVNRAKIIMEQEHKDHFYIAEIINPRLEIKEKKELLETIHNLITIDVFVSLHRSLIKKRSTNVEEVIMKLENKIYNENREDLMLYRDVFRTLFGLNDK